MVHLKNTKKQKMNYYKRNNHPQKPEIPDILLSF